MELFQVPEKHNPRFGGVGVLRSCRKPHKSKDHKILHRNYVQKNSQLRKKISFFLDQKMFWKIFGEKKARKFPPKNPENFQISQILKFQNFEI